MVNDTLNTDKVRQVAADRRKLAVNRAAAVGVSVAILAGALFSSALPAGAAASKPSSSYTRVAPTATPCPIHCYGNVNHR